MEIESPKQRFLQKADWIKAHNVMIDSAAFERGHDFAMLQMNESVLNSSIPADEKAHRLAGASQFMAIFMRLSEQPNKKAPKSNDNLEPTS